MAQPQQRHDGYGRPLPELTDAAQEVLYAREQNVAQRRLVLALFEQLAHDLLRRGVYAEASIGFRVQDGMLQAEIDVAVIRHWRPAL
jgi:hypothetical protein